jgi:hypothetical protein
MCSHQQSGEKVMMEALSGLSYLRVPLLASYPLKSNSIAAISSSPQAETESPYTTSTLNVV